MRSKTELPMEVSKRISSLAESGDFTIAELCEQFSISRKTGHKWILRYRDSGVAALADRSRAPVHTSGRTPAEVAALG